MCVRQMQTEGITEAEAADRIYMMDIDGLITKNRVDGARHSLFAKDMPETKDLLQVPEVLYNSPSFLDELLPLTYGKTTFLFLGIL